MIIDAVKKKIVEQNADWATPVLTILRDTVREQYNNWFPSIPPMQSINLLQSGQVAARPDLAFIVCGYESDGTSRIFGLGQLNGFFSYVT